MTNSRPARPSAAAMLMGVLTLTTALATAGSASASTSSVSIHAGGNCVPFDNDSTSLRYLHGSVENTSVGADQVTRVVQCPIPISGSAERWVLMNVKFRKWTQSEPAWCTQFTMNSHGRYLNATHKSTSTASTGYPRLQFQNPDRRNGQTLVLLCGVPGNSTALGDRSALIDIQLYSVH